MDAATIGKRLRQARQREERAARGTLPPSLALAVDRGEMTAEEAQAQDLLQRAGTGDQAAMAKLRPFLDSRPEAWRSIGDMAYQAEISLVKAVAGSNRLVREGIERKLAALRGDLAPATPLERLLVDRIAVSWLALAHAEMLYYQQLSTLSVAHGDYHQRRIDRCQHRYLAAIKALATVRRLQLPALTIASAGQVNVAERQVNVAVAEGAGRP